MKNNPHKVIIAMGSQSDWKTLKFTSSILTQLKIKHQKKIISAHRTPKRLYEFAESAHKDGIKIIIAGAGCIIYTSPSPRDPKTSRMPSSA